MPEGYITSHANMSRITTFPLERSRELALLPRRRHLRHRQGASTRPTRASRSASATPIIPRQGPDQKRACAGRVWSICRRAAPSQNFSDAYFRGAEGAEDYPLFVKPDQPLSVHDVMALMRDHYEGTPYDMTKGVDAGPFGSPLRLRDLAFSVDGKGYMWERPISTQQAGFVIVTQSRKHLPDAIGGVTWFTPDEASDLVLHAALLRHQRAAGTVHPGRLPEVLLGFRLVGDEPGLEPRLRPLVARLSRTSRRPRPSRNRRC